MTTVLRLEQESRVHVCLQQSSHGRQYAEVKSHTAMIHTIKLPYALEIALSTVVIQFLASISQNL